jgi:hypothetical protein
VGESISETASRPPRSSTGNDAVRASHRQSRFKT